MKQLTSIFLIAVFALSQYAKQFAYMECKLANSFKSSTEQCDCEKKYDTHSLNDKKPAGPQTHFHPVIDEYYAAPENDIVTSSINLLIKKTVLPSSPNLSEGSNSAPYRPPQV
jgi:predicted metalloendopeptidase